MVPIEELRFYDVISRSLMVEEGCYTIYVGSSSADKENAFQIAIPGRKTGMRNLKIKTPADHYDEYENIVLTEGQFGFSAATLLDSQKEGVLCYRDCKIEEGMKEISLHLMSEHGAQIEVLINGKTVGSWSGDTRTYAANSRPVMGPLMIKDAEERINSWTCVYADVKIPVSCIVKEGESGNMNLELRFSGDVKLCYFQMKKRG